MPAEATALAARQKVGGQVGVCAFLATADSRCCRAHWQASSCSSSSLDCSCSSSTWLSKPCTSAISFMIRGSCADSAIVGAACWSCRP
eukprot:3540420-Prymnesium_polylepis.2